MNPIAQHCRGAFGKREPVRLRRPITIMEPSCLKRVLKARECLEHVAAQTVQDLLLAFGAVLKPI